MFSDPAAFDRAAKSAIKASGRNPREAYRQMLRDRFLCRVFISSDQYVLKGDSGMLARRAELMDRSHELHELRVPTMSCLGTELTRPVP